MLSNALSNAVAFPFVRHFAAVQIVLANTGTTVNLCDGSGFLTFNVPNANGNAVATTFTSFDPIFGSLGTVSPIPEAVTTSAPSTQITLLPPSTTGVAALNDTANQLSPVTLWWGILNEQTGVPYDTDLVWQGNLDFVKTTIDGQLRSVVLEIISGLDKMYPTDEGMRLNDQSHQSVWPGETGLSNVIQAAVAPTWGSSLPTPLYPKIVIAPTANDEQSGITSAGLTTGQTWNGH